MKKITMEINGATSNEGAKEIGEALNNLSGIVAADVVLSDGRAYAYAGDKLQSFAASDAVREAGHNCRVIEEEYLTDVEDYKKALNTDFYQ